LRISEAVTLPVSAVDSKQMVLRIIGKRNKERALPLTESILEMLREVWSIHRSRQWLFPSRRVVTHLPDALPFTHTLLKWYCASVRDGLRKGHDTTV
jgi:site-specific recombinase XerD